MFWKNILQNSLIVLFVFLLAVSSFAEDSNYVNDSVPDTVIHINQDTIFNDPEIQIIYPKDSQFVTAIDSTFIIGNVRIPNSKVTEIEVNGIIFKVHEDGGFIAFVPIQPGYYKINIVAFESRDLTLSRTDYKYHYRKTLTIQVPEPLKPIPYDSLIIEKEIDQPSKFQTFVTGEELNVSFKGTPRCIAWFEIEGIADSIPMSETQPRPQPYWGESVFGSGAVPDSLLINGIYSGTYRVKPSDQADSVKIIYHLKYPKPSQVLDSFMKDTSGQREAFFQHKYFQYLRDSIYSESSYSVSFNSENYPFTVQFTDSIQTIRHGPRMGYFSIFQPEGVEALVVGEEDDWYICQLSETQKAFVDKSLVKRLPDGIVPPRSYVSVLRHKFDDSKSQLEVPMRGKHPFRITELNRRHLKLELFGVTSNTDWIRYDNKDKMIDYINWSQPEPDLYQIDIFLTKDIWGYDPYYIGNSFYLDINKPPRKVKKIEDKTIVLDPGHSGDPGSIGPTGYTEKEANLGIALELKKMLEDKHVNVIMTRSDNSHVPLYDRPKIAKAADADLFISIHNNALPDGVNPFENNGSSCYYYHPHSLNLARFIQNEMTREVKLGDYGIYHGNLAVDRPTQYPAVLVECAFMIIPEQEAMLKTEKFRKKVAKSILKGIEEFLKDYDEHNKQ